MKHPVSKKIEAIWRGAQEERAYSTIVLMLGLAGLLGLGIANMNQKNSNLIDQAKIEDQTAAAHEDNLSALCRAQKLYALDPSGIAPVYPQPYINYNNPSQVSFSGQGGVNSGTGWAISQNNLVLKMVDTVALTTPSLEQAMMGAVLPASQWKNVNLTYLRTIAKPNTPYAIEAVEVEASRPLGGVTASLAASIMGGATITNRAQLTVAPPPPPSCALSSNVANGAILETPFTVTVSLDCKNVLLATQINQSSPTPANFPADPNVIKTQFNFISGNQPLRSTLTRPFSAVGTYSLSGTYTGIGTGTDGKATYVSGTTGGFGFTIQDPPVCQLTASPGNAVTEPATITVNMSCNGPTAYRDINWSVNLPIVLNAPGTTTVVGQSMVLNAPGTYQLVGQYKGFASNAVMRQTTPLTLRIDPAPEPNCWLKTNPSPPTVTSPATITVDMACDRAISFRDLSGTWGLPVVFGQVGQQTVFGRYKGVYASSTLRQTPPLSLRVDPPADPCQNDLCHRFLLPAGPASDSCLLLNKCWLRTSNLPCANGMYFSQFTRNGYPPRRCYFLFNQPSATTPTGGRSDMRLKDNIKPIDDILAKLSTLRGVEFDWNEKGPFPGQHEIGVIAQEVEKAFPTVVSTDPISGFKSVNYSVLVAPLIEAVKVLSTENKKIKTENIELRKEQKELKHAFCQRFPDEIICRP